MDTKTSKVKNVQGNGTYDSQHGTLYKFEYEFEDGQVLNANHKTQNHFKVGDEVEYKVKGSNDYGSWGSVSKPSQSNYNGYKKSSQGSTASFALSYAKDIAVAHIENDKKMHTTSEILAIATDFNNWLKNNS